jgi:hypothetical protein
MEEYKTYTCTTMTLGCKQWESHTYKYPYIFHGLVGFMAEYDLMKSVTVGLNVKGLMGKVWGSAQKDLRDLSYGLHATIPVTFHFGKDMNWDFRMEPLAILLKDYSNFIGGKAGLGYRF